MSKGIFTTQNPSVNNFLKLLFFFSYACDDFIINDTTDAKLDQLRSTLVALRNSNPSSEIISSNPKEAETPTNSPSSSRSLRPRSARRRSQSMDSVNGGVENRPAHKKSRKSTGSVEKSGKNNRKSGALKNLVGLRNLGNTCFMSAVLQSLG